MHYYIEWHHWKTCYWMNEMKWMNEWMNLYSPRSLRGKLPGRILICLSLSLLCLYTIFLIGIEQTATRAGCILVAVLIHYFTLASLAWMAVEATNLYMFLVKVMNLGLRHFLVKASLLAWGRLLMQGCMGSQCGEKDQGWISQRVRPSLISS